MALPVWGPSPRIRGKFSLEHSIKDQSGTIPANTGKIRCRCLIQQHRGDHPREYGENDTVGALCDAWVGPSPRIRGKSTLAITTSVAGRTIPANTGKIELEENPHADLGDHPREYGENHSPCRRCAPCAGPSPRIRGKSIKGVKNAVDRGTIPANTGKIPCTLYSPASSRDHPREYGENLKRFASKRAAGGPSPRIRGKFLDEMFENERRGTIPANTGKMRRGRGLRNPARDHPREYGENPQIQQELKATAGPSPRIRGKLIMWPITPSRMGTIPANTGKM